MQLYESGSEQDSKVEYEAAAMQLAFWFRKNDFGPARIPRHITVTESFTPKSFANGPAYVLSRIRRPRQRKTHKFTTQIMIDMIPVSRE